VTATSWGRRANAHKKRKSKKPQDTGEIFRRGEPEDCLRKGELKTIVGDRKNARGFSAFKPRAVSAGGKKRREKPCLGERKRGSNFKEQGEKK